MRITLFRDFIEDKRLSMDIYSDCLTEALRARFPQRSSIRDYRPHQWTWLGDGVWAMRLARFVLYPIQARRQQVQLAHILDHGYSHLVFAIGSNRTIVTVHDLVPLIRWRREIPGISAARRPWLNMLAFNALKRAAHVIAVSENTKQDTIRLCKVSPERVTVIPYGIDPVFRSFSSIEENAARDKWKLPNDCTKRILIVGSGFYKNHSGAIRTLEHLQQLIASSVQLVRVGFVDKEWNQWMNEHQLHQAPIHLGIVSMNEMPEIYNIVDCLLFPSLYEGFGLPLLEAMACGTPVVASNAASLPEVIGEAGLMCDPHDYEGLAYALRDILTLDELRQSLISRGLSRAAQFTWEETAQKTLEVYEKVASEL